MVINTPGSDVILYTNLRKPNIFLYFILYLVSAYDTMAFFVIVA